jgi:hypothetical protein
VNQFAWIVLLVLFSGLLLALVRGGWTGPGGASAWFRTKFKGQPA